MKFDRDKMEAFLERRITMLRRAYKIIENAQLDIINDDCAAARGHIDDAIELLDDELMNSQMERKAEQEQAEERAHA